MAEREHFIKIYPNRAKSKMKDKVLQILQINISPQITRINQIWELYTYCPLGSPPRSPPEEGEAQSGRI